MTKFVAISAITIGTMCNTAALWWFAFGVWPRSWLAIVIFGGLVPIVLVGLRLAIEAEN